MSETHQEESADAALSPGLRALLLANFCGTFAYLGLFTFVGDQIFSRTGRELDLGFLALVVFVPAMLLSPFGGVLNDRFDRRKVYSVSTLFMIVAAMSVLLFVWSDRSGIWPFFVSLAVYSGARSFAAPAIRSLPIDLATSENLERVTALKALARQAGVIAGPVIAGFLAAVAPELPYVLSVVLLLVSLGLLRLVPASGVARIDGSISPRQVWSEAADGLRYLRSNRVVFAAVGLDLFAVLLGGAVALLPAIAERRLGVGEVGLGWLRAADGIGAALMSIALSVWVIRRRIGVILLGSVAFFGVMTIVLGVTREYWVAFVALALLSAADSVSVYIRSTLVPLATPEEMRGRVSATENVFIGGSNELGALESGVAAQLMGLVLAVVTGGVGTLVVVAIWWWRFPELRKIDRFEDVRVDRIGSPSG